MTKLPLTTLFALLLLTPAAPALAEHTPAELEHRRKVFAELAAAAAEAEKLPPCAGLDRLAEAVLKHEPPRDCKKARLFYDYISTKVDRPLRDGCRTLTAHLEGVFRDPLYCENREQPGWLDAQYKATRKIKTEAIETWFDKTLPEIDAILEEAELASSTIVKGEFARMECQLPVLAGMQFRKKQLSLWNQGYGRAEAELSSGCRTGVPPGGVYLDYLRSGIEVDYEAR